MNNSTGKQFSPVLFFLLIFLSIPAAGFSQDIPDGFMEIRLGLEIHEVKQILEENSYFDYRGDPDVSMLMTSGENLIETRGFSFIDKGYFHFYENRLFIITIVLNREKMDFYTMHMNLEEKYGRADRLTPEGVYWESESVSLSLEKPLSVKYTDKKARESIFSSARDIEITGAALKEQFLDLF